MSSPSAVAGPARPAVAPRPLHLWVVGGLSLLWNAFGALDYAMTQFRVEAYMGQFSAEQLAYFYGFPWWADAAWAFGVWGAVAGSVGLLLARRWAVIAYAVSVAGMVWASVYTHGLTDGAELMGPGALAFSVAIWLVGMGLTLYAVIQARRGRLR